MWISKGQRDRLGAMREAMDAAVRAVADNAAVINEAAAIVRAWTPGAYCAGEVRAFEGIPYRCVQAHDSADNLNWTPGAAPALWMQYHGTTPETARAWIPPAGAHDAYRAGEYMVWTDGAVYRCLADTAYSPPEHADAWEAHIFTP